MELIVFLIIMGAIAWAVNAAPFIDGNWKMMIYIVLGLYSLIWTLQHIGLVKEGFLAIH